MRITIRILQTGTHIKMSFPLFYYDDCQPEYDIAPFFDTSSSGKPWRQSIINLKSKNMNECEKKTIHSWGNYVSEMLLCLLCKAKDYPSIHLYVQTVCSQ